MKWNTKELSPETVVIEDGDVIVGSIARFGDKWMVEIMWGGPTGDLRFEAPSIISALAFIEGVEKAFAAMAAARA